MPKPTEASSNTPRQATPELEIHGPTANELPATWLTGETITLRATGGHGRYQWLTTAPKAVTIKHQQDDRCEVAIEGTAAAKIIVVSARNAAVYGELEGNKPLLKAVDTRPRPYREAEHCCQQLGGSLPSKKTIEAILKARKTEVVAWAKKSFPVTLGISPKIWLKNENADANSGHPSINLETAACFDHTEAIETKKNAIETQQKSIQALKDKEQELLAKGANLPEATIKRNAELAGFEEIIKQNEFTYRYDVNTIKDPTPNSKGDKIIEKFVNQALAAHREKHIALSELREKLYTAQGDIKRQWEELTELKIQQAKVKANSGHPSINLETEACFDHTAAIETKRNEIAAKQNSIQQLKAKELQLLEKGANLPEAEIKRNAELAGFDEVVKQNELAYHTEGNTFKDPIPSTMGDKIIEKFVSEALAEYREKQTALGDIREKLHTAQGDIKRQWKELTELKIQQAKVEANSGQPSINLETEDYSDQIEAIETKKNAIEAKQNSIQVLKDEEQALLVEGANLPEDEIIKNAENTATKIAIENGNFVHRVNKKGGISDIKPDGIGERFIKASVDEVLAKHREKQTGLSELREKLHTAQDDIKRQWEELTELKIQQAKDSVTTYTLCQFNPATLDQAVAAWVPDAGEATPGDRFTTGQCFFQRSGASLQLSHCQFNA